MPQGSILGAHLFLIYMNNIQSATEYFTFILYADDTTLFSTMAYSLPALPNEHNISINGELLRVNDWLLANRLLSGVPDLFDRNKILSGGDLSYYQVPHCIRVFFYFVWFVFIHHNLQFYFELCTYCNILDIYLS